MGEAGPKSATLLTVAEGHISVEEVPTSTVEFRASTLEVTDAASDEALRSKLRAHLRQEAEALHSSAGVLRLSLVGAQPRYWQILRDRDVWVEQAAAMARDTGVIWLEKLVFKLDAPGTEADAASAVGELERIMAEVCAEPGFAAFARTEAETVFSQVPAAVRAKLWPDEDSAAVLADRLAKRGAERVLARMKGTGS